MCFELDTERGTAGLEIVDTGVVQAFAWVAGIGGGGISCLAASMEEA